MFVSLEVIKSCAKSVNMAVIAPHKKVKIIIRKVFLGYFQVVYKPENCKQNKIKKRIP